MTVAEEIMNLKNRLAFNQKLFGQCMLKNDTATMQFLELRNRELIDHLNRLEDTRAGKVLGVMERGARPDKSMYNYCYDENPHRHH